jgi:RNA polymerase sigma-70 factor (ECF subfamily)
MIGAPPNSPHPPVDPLDRPEFVDRLRRGDAEAFESLVRQTGGRMLAVARRFLSNEEDAREAVQDAYVSAFKAIASFEGSSKVTTWLHRITVNASLMKRRAKSRRPERSIEDLLPRFREDGHRDGVLPAWPPVPESRLVTEELQAMVRAHIDALPDDYRTVLVLRDLEGLDTASTAEVLGISEAAVKTRLHRARQALRTLLEGDLAAES